MGSLQSGGISQLFMADDDDQDTGNFYAPVGPLLDLVITHQPQINQLRDYVVREPPHIETDSESGYDSEAEGREDVNVSDAEAESAEGNYDLHHDRRVQHRGRDPAKSQQRVSPDPGNVHPPMLEEFRPRTPPDPQFPAHNVCLAPTVPRMPHVPPLPPQLPIPPVVQQQQAPINIPPLLQQPPIPPVVQQQQAPINVPPLLQQPPIPPVVQQQQAPINVPPLLQQPPIPPVVQQQQAPINVAPLLQQPPIPPVVQQQQAPFDVPPLLQQPPIPPVVQQQQAPFDMPPLLQQPPIPPVVQQQQAPINVAPLLQQLPIPPVVQRQQAPINVAPLPPQLPIPPVVLQQQAPIDVLPLQQQPPNRSEVLQQLVPQFNQQVPIFQPIQDHPGEQLRQDPRAENDPPPAYNNCDDVQLQRRVINALEDSRQFMELYKNTRMSRTIVEGIAADSARLISELKNHREFLDEIPAMRQLLQRVGDRILEIEQFVMTARQNVTESAPAQRPRSCSPEQRRGRHRSYDTLGRLESDIEFQLARMSDNIMENIRPEATLSNEKIRTLYEVVMPQVKEAVSACQTTLRDYTASSNYDRALAAKAQQRCQTVQRWVSDLINCHRDQKLHLDKNRKNKEINFDPFKPGRSVSIFEFLMKFERFSEDYLSEESKADLLLDKYLDSSITESYAELLVLKGDYRGIKGWLIAKFGSVVPIAHGYVKAIKSLPVPSDSDLPAVIKHLRSIHCLLVRLSTLRIGPGEPVPRLAEYLGSNAFLIALIKAIPPSIRKEVSRGLVQQGLEDPYSLEGPEHLTNILSCLITKCRELEWEVFATPTQPVAKRVSLAASKPKKTVNTAAGGNHIPIQRNPNRGQNNRIPSTKTNHGHGGQSAPQQGNGQSQNQPRGSSAYCPPSQGNDFIPELRWKCPFRDHQDHDIQTCSDFFHASPRERRARCRFNCCYTCMAKDRRCRGGCSRVAEVPPDLICKECAQSMTAGSAPSVLFCGLNHEKPPFAVLVRELEAWVPSLNVKSLGDVISVNLSRVGAHNSGPVIPSSNLAKTRPPTNRFSNLTYNTTTGEASLITEKDIINTATKEIAYYTMQHIKIGHRTLLVLYDSGSNAHLIEGAVAEDLCLDVITDEMVPIGGVGAKATWSQYGMYQLTLGPDIHGQLHQLDVQGMSVITKTIPEADLEPLWQPTRKAVGPDCHLPLTVGGTPVSLLIGIKSTALSPKLITLLPSGLGVYESAIKDVAGSNICFGGPHQIFSEAYRKVGRMFNHVEIIFSEMAQAYLNAPRNFVAADPEDHGPMRSPARELDIVEECYRAVPQTKPDPTTGSGSGGVALHEGDHLVEFPPIISSASSTTECSIHQSDTQSLACKHLKAKIPLQKLKGLQDELDIDEIVEYRCEKCARCPDCRMSARDKTKSLQREFEREPKPFTHCAMAESESSGPLVNCREQNLHLENTLLIKGNPESGGNYCGISSKGISTVINHLVLAGTPRPQTSVAEAPSVFKAQNDAQKLPEFPTHSADSENTLPDKSPLQDHLDAYLDDKPDWYSQLKEPLQDLRTCRLPTGLDRIELTLGESSDEEWESAHRKLISRIEIDRQSWIGLQAADTEGDQAALDWGRTTNGFQGAMACIVRAKLDGESFTFDPGGTRQ